MAIQFSVRRMFVRFKTYLSCTVANDITLEIELMTLAFATGIMDAVTFPDFHVFVSNQTGNTALLAVGTLNIGGSILSLANVGASLGAFALGGVICGQLGNLFGRQKRVWLMSTTMVQAALVVSAASLRSKANATDRPNNLGIIILLAVASGGQVTLARTVHIPEVPTAMVTSAYIDLFIDPDIFKLHNRPRNRRIAFVCFLLLGSFIGAILYRFVSPGFALYIAALTKLIVSLAFCFNAKAQTECE